MSDSQIEILTAEEEKELTEDKRREEADDRDRDKDIAEGWVTNE